MRWGSPQPVVHCHQALPAGTKAAARRWRRGGSGGRRTVLTLAEPGGPLDVLGPRGGVVEPAVLPDPEARLERRGLRERQVPALVDGQELDDRAAVDVRREDQAGIVGEVGGGRAPRDRLLEEDGPGVDVGARLAEADGVDGLA